MFFQNERSGQVNFHRRVNVLALVCVMKSVLFIYIGIFLVNKIMGV